MQQMTSYPREQGTWPKIRKGAGGEQGKRNLGAGSTKIWKRQQGAAENWEMEQGARKTDYHGAKAKMKKDRCAKRDEKGAVKICKKEQAPKQQ